jgi:D-glycero-D-manno-heptose 1,7-bisphosphate phosphatase
MDTGTLQRLVILDRDGTLNVDQYVTYRAEQFELIPGVKEGLLRLARMGCAFAIVSNQAGIGRGDYSAAEMWQFNELLFQALEPLPFSRACFHFCPHNPLQVECACRKPHPALLLQAAEARGIPIGQSYMIGDKLSDILAGVRAECKKTILVRTGITDDRERYPGVQPDFEVDDLVAAAEVIIEMENVQGTLGMGRGR